MAKTSSAMGTYTEAALSLAVVTELAKACITSTTPVVTTITAPTLNPVGKNSKIQRFVQQLWEIVNSGSDLVGWSDDGARVVVHRTEDFAKHILPRYFDHSNMSSFTRQLHFYGFRKTLTRKRSKAHNWECQHKFFVRGRPELLVRITRKRCNQQMASQEEVAQLRKELQQLRETVAQQQKQMQSMSTMLLALHSSQASDRKRKANTHFARPKQERRIQIDPSFDLTPDSLPSEFMPSPEFENESLSSLFDEDDQLLYGLP